VPWFDELLIAVKAVSGSRRPHIDCPREPVEIALLPAPPWTTKVSASSMS
jgi:hypothetical protein